MVQKENYKVKKINKKIRKIALTQAISKKNLNKNLFIFSDVKTEIKRPKDFNKFLITNNLNNSLIVSDKDTFKNIFKSARNIKDIKVIEFEGTNIYDLFKFKNVLFSLTSIKKLEERLLNEKINFIDPIRSPIITEKLQHYLNKIRLFLKFIKLLKKMS